MPTPSQAGSPSLRAASLNRASTMATGSISPATRACLAMASSFLAGVSSPDYTACGSVYLLLLPAKLVLRPLGLATSLPMLLEHPVTLGLSLSARREASVNVCRIAAAMSCTWSTAQGLGADDAGWGWRDSRWRPGRRVGCLMFFLF